MITDLLSTSARYVPRNCSKDRFQTAFDPQILPLLAFASLGCLLTVIEPNAYQTRMLCVCSTMYITDSEAGVSMLLKNSNRKCTSDCSVPRPTILFHAGLSGMPGHAAVFRHRQEWVHSTKGLPDLGLHGNQGPVSEPYRRIAWRSWHRVSLGSPHSSVEEWRYRGAAAFGTLCQGDEAGLHTFNRPSCRQCAASDRPSCRRFCSGIASDSRALVLHADSVGLQYCMLVVVVLHADGVQLQYFMLIMLCPSTAC